MREGRELQAGEGGVLRCGAGSHREQLELPDDAPVRRLGAEQSNSSVLVGERVIVKAYRKLEAGIHPELEIGRFLTDVAGYANTPPLLGSIERVGADGNPSAYAAAFGFVANQGDGWRYTLDYLDRALEEIRVTPESGRRPAAEQHEAFLAGARLLGRRTAELHRALAIDTDDPAFAREPVTGADLEAWRVDARAQVEAGFAILEQARKGAAEDRAAELGAALSLRPAVEAALADDRPPPEGLAKTRLHGDYHLGQVLAGLGDFVVLDFEGEPMRPLEERRAKGSPLRDVAGMLRSFDYAAWAGVQRFAESDPAAPEQLLGPALQWRDLAQAAFMDGYREAIGDCPSWPADPAEADRLIRLFTIQKLFYEVGYEAANRPAWLRIPLSGIRDLFANNPGQQENAGAALQG
jgi:maltose alpha-D-glucosyltransferase / alpha-amylase